MILACQGQSNKKAIPVVEVDTTALKVPGRSLSRVLFKPNPV